MQKRFGVPILCLRGYLLQKVQLKTDTNTFLWAVIVDKRIAIAIEVLKQDFIAVRDGVGEV